MTILSDPTRTLLIMQVNPWQRLSEHWPRVTVDYVDLGSPFIHGQTRWRAGKPQAILLHKDLTQVQRRCTLAHELEHLDRGAPCESLRASIERRVLFDAARYLLPDLDLLAEALSTYDLRRASAELWVTYPVLVDRLRSLRDAELELVTNWREHVA